MKLLSTLFLLTAIAPLAAAQFIPIEDEPAVVMTSTAHGVATDTAGRVLPNARVQALNDGREPVVRRETVTDERGEFAFEDLADGYWRITADHAEYAKEWERERWIEFPADASKFPLTIALQPPLSYAATVIDQRGEPVAGATVIHNSERLEGDERSLQGHSIYDLRVTSTDALGRFQLTRLRAGEIAVILEHPEYANTRAYGLKVGTHDDRLVIEDGQAFTGIVSTESGPLPDVTVAVNTLSLGARPLGMWTVKTDKQGRFTIDHVPDLSRYNTNNAAMIWVTLKDDDWKSDRYRIFLDDSQQLPEVEVFAWTKGDNRFTRGVFDVGKKEDPTEPEEPKEPEPPAEPTGIVRVVQPAKRDLDRGPGTYRVTLRSVDDGTRNRSYNETVECDAFGTAEFPDVPVGDYVALSRNTGTFHCPPIPVTVSADSEQSITLEPGGASLTGKIVGVDDPAGPRHLSWFALEGLNGVKPQGTADLLNDGHYEIRGLSPGSYRLVYDGRGMMDVPIEVALREGLNRFDLELPTGRIEGRLVDVAYPEVRGRDNGQIQVRPTDPTVGTDKRRVLVRADDEGRFMVEHMAAGRYVVNMRVPETNELLRAMVELHDDHSVAQVELRPSGRIGNVQGQVLGIDRLKKSPLHQPSLSVVLVPLDAQGYDFDDTYGGRTDRETGAYEIRGVPEGLYGLKTGGRYGEVNLWYPNVEVRAGFAHVFDIQIPEFRQVEIHLDTPNLNPSKRIWYLHVDGARIKYDYFIGSGASGLTAGSGPLGLPYGNYVVEGDFGDGGVAEKAFEVTPGEGVQQIVIQHPLAAEAD